MHVSNDVLVTVAKDLFLEALPHRIQKDPNFLLGTSFDKASAQLSKEFSQFVSQLQEKLEKQTE